MKRFEILFMIVVSALVLISLYFTVNAWVNEIRRIDKICNLTNDTIQTQIGQIDCIKWRAGNYTMSILTSR